MIKNKKFRLPNLIIPGAMKSGTTLLANLLSLHPEIYVPEMKEPRFFVSEVLKEVNPDDPSYQYLITSSQLTLDDYVEFYNNNNLGKYKYLVDASIHYLYHYSHSIAKIKKIITNPIKILIILRNPVKRSYSQYFYNYYLYSNFSFIEAFEKEYYFKSKGFDIMYYLYSPSLYCKQVEAYLEQFSDVKIILFEELIKDPNSVMKEVFEFLGLYPINFKEIEKFNETFIPKYKMLPKITNKLEFFKKAIKTHSEALYNKLKITYKRYFFTNKKPQLEPKLYSEVMKIYGKDIEKLSNILNKNLEDIWR